RIGEDVHPGTIIDINGNAVEGDAGVALKAIRNGTAALATLGGIGEALGGYKGYGYAVVVELLSAALQDGNYGKMLDGKNEKGENVPYHLGHFFIAIDTDHFLGEELCRKKSGEILRKIRASKKAPGAERIYTAGEKEYLVWLDRKDKGVPITEAVQAEVSGIRDKLGLTQYKFPWE
ncbi:MAG: Ldh family oxidoreductase, partial [Clostridia bacterium]|nr:Ldh family oxidoreductase [Clostridia bacterium]